MAYTEDTPPQDTEMQQIVKWNVGSGMLNSDNKKTDDAQPWVVQTMYYSFGLSSMIPSSLITVGGTTYSQSGPGVGIRPMGIPYNLESPVVITLTDSSGPVDIVGRGMTITENLNGAPAALWSKKGISRTQAPSGKDMVIPSALMGINLIADQYLGEVTIPAFDINNLAYTHNTPKLLPFFYNTCTNKGPLVKCFSYPAAPALPQTLVYTTIMQTIMRADIITVRNAIYAALESVGIEAPANPDLSVMQTSADLVLQAFPVLAAIGCYQTAQPQGPVAVKPRPALLESVEAPRALVAPVLQGVLRRYQTRNVAAAGDGNKLPLKRNQMLGKWTSFTGLGGDAKRHALTTLESNVFSKTIHKGGAVVLRLDPDARHTLDLEGDLSVMVAFFDEYDNVMEIKLVNNVKHYLTPIGAAQAVLFTHESNGHDTIGWQRDTMMTRVNPLWCVGDGCLLHVQNSRRITVNKRKDEQGLVEVAHLLDMNEVINSNKILSYGWIQTLLYTKNPYVAVLVEGLETDAVQVTLALDRIPVHPGKSTPVQTIKFKDNTLLIFEAPEIKDQASYIGLIAYSSLASQKIQGIYSIEKIENAPMEIWSSLSLNYDALDMQGNETESTRLTLSMV